MTGATLLGVVQRERLPALAAAVARNFQVHHYRVRRGAEIPYEWAYFLEAELAGTGGLEPGGGSIHLLAESPAP
jgi:hypothetical protein